MALMLVASLLVQCHSQLGHGLFFVNCMGNWKGCCLYLDNQFKHYSVTIENICCSFIFKQSMLWKIPVYSNIFFQCC